jgi:DNA-directed RNA polymerase specialized sigma24 family protein
VRLLGRYLNSTTETQRISDLRQRANSSRVAREADATVRGPARLTQQQNDAIAALYRQGRRPIDIARELGTTEWTVHHRLNRLGIERRPTGLTPAEAEEAVLLYTEGVPITELAKRYERSWKTVAKALPPANRRGTERLSP